MNPEQINQWLRRDGYPVSLVVRGESLYLQATVPIGDGQRRQKQFALGLKLGRDGLEQAKLKALSMGVQLNNGTFTLGDWVKPREKPDRETIAQLVDRFEKYYRSARSVSDETWRQDWRSVFRQLPQDKEFTAAIALELVLKKREGTRIRLKVCQKLQQLANFAGIDIDLAPYSSGYRAKERRLPTDKQIIEAWEFFSFNPP